MKQIKMVVCFFAMLLFLFLASCNQTAVTSESKGSDTTPAVSKKDTSSMPMYDAAMDPLIVGAAFSKKLGDTLGMKMFEVAIKPGDSVAIHTHPDHTFYVLQGGKIEVNIKGAGVKIFDLQPGMGWISGPLTDFGKNIGNTTVKWLEVDVYRPRAS
ncbi:MAG: cupin domain-containing protein [Agriterribacter sp.]